MNLLNPKLLEHIVAVLKTSDELGVSDQDLIQLIRDVQQTKFMRDLKECHYE